MPVVTCHICGYAPVSTDAKCCPKCNGLAFMPPVVKSCPVCQSSFDSNRSEHCPACNAIAAKCPYCKAEYNSRKHPLYCPACKRAFNETTRMLYRVEKCSTCFGQGYRSWTHSGGCQGLEASSGTSPCYTCGGWGHRGLYYVFTTDHRTGEIEDHGLVSNNLSAEEKRTYLNNFRACPDWVK